MKSKYTIELATTMREQLTEVVRGLEHFSLEQGDGSTIRINKEIWQHSSKKKHRSLLSKCILRAQKTLGLINVRRFSGRADIAFSNGGFLFTRQPYMTYIEYGPQVFGYRTVYTKWISKLLLNYFVQDPHLICLLFRTHAGYQSFINLPTLRDKARKRVEQIAHVIYPPIDPLSVDLKRFENPPVVKLFFIKNRFYEGGGKELLNAFLKIYEDYPQVMLTVVANLAYLHPEDKEIMETHPCVDLHHVGFTRQELFDQFFLTHHIAVMPTYRDSFNMTINEAIAAGLPVITTNFFSIPERVIDGSNGYLCEAPIKPYDPETFVIDSFPKDLAGEVDALRKAGKLQYIEEFLYEKIIRLVDDNQLLQTMASNAKKYYDEYLNGHEVRKQMDEKLMDGMREWES